jgi:ribosomal protein S18 acetylase RimI-like enzyme/SAM-dependent methyltransferase
MAEVDSSSNEPRVGLRAAPTQGRSVEVPGDAPTSRVHAPAREIHYRLCRPEDAPELARLHVRNLSDRLPAELLTSYYRALLATRSNFCICATDGAEMVGYLGSVSNRSQVVAVLLERDLPRIIGIGLRSPWAFWVILTRFGSWLWSMRIRNVRLPTCEYRPVVVADSHRGLGIARRLLEAADKAAVERHTESVFVRVADDNSRAAKLYENHGFRTVCSLGGANVMTRRVIPSSPGEDRTGEDSRSDGTRLCRTCPLCGSDQVVTMASSAMRKFAKCQRCGVRYFDPARPREEVRTYFADTYITSERDLHDAYEAVRDTVFTRFATLVLRKKPAPGRILDIGCAGGYFLGRYFGPAGWELWGVELSKYAAGAASRKGVHVHNGEMNSASLPAAFFDVVTVLDTFYYFPEPFGDLRSIRKHMKADGLLFIEVSHANARVWRLTSRLAQILSRSSNSLFNSDHVFFYTPKAVSMLLEKCGFRVEEIVVLPASRHQSLYQRLVYGLYYAGSRVAHFLSCSKWVWGPRFLVVASPAESARQPEPSS